jgi:2-keto-4-pentenoate hydratase
MGTEKSADAASAIWQAWQTHTLIDGLPEACRLATLADGYAAQQALAALSGARPIGWKIAATSLAGQKHIGVDGPLAGRLLESKLHQSGATLDAGHLHMAVAEAEFAFRMGADLPGKGTDYAVEEVMAAVAALHVAIEIPDSRYRDFTIVGAAQLIADNACTEYFVLGPEAPESWRTTDLVTHPVQLSINDVIVAEGTGANVLGDPRLALTWLANDRVRHGGLLAAGEIITTGTCIVPAAIEPGDHLSADFGALGIVTVTMGAEGA